MSVTWYFNDALVPGVAEGSATKVTTPVVVFNVYVPTPLTITTPSASHASGEDPGVMRHVTEAFNPAGELAKPEAPVRVVNATVPPGLTDFDSGKAVGAPGGFTIGEIFALVTCPVESDTTYFTGAALPLNVGNGSNVTVPFAFTV